MYFVVHVKRKSIKHSLIDSKIIKKDKIYSNVSRETLMELDDYSQSILNRNKKVNSISSSTEKSINTRHIYDMQTIDFINKNDINICTDLGLVQVSLYSFRYFDEI